MFTKLQAAGMLLAIFGWSWSGNAVSVMSSDKIDNAGVVIAGQTPLEEDWADQAMEGNGTAGNGALHNPARAGTRLQPPVPTGEKAGFSNDQASPTLPDGGPTVALLGAILMGIECLRRRAGRCMAAREHSR